MPHIQLKAKKKRENRFAEIDVYAERSNYEWRSLIEDLEAQVPIQVFTFLRAVSYLS